MALFSYLFLQKNLKLKSWPRKKINILKAVLLSSGFQIYIMHGSFKSDHPYSKSRCSTEVRVFVDDFLSGSLNKIILFSKHLSLFYLLLIFWIVDNSAKLQNLDSAAVSLLGNCVFSG